MAEMATYVGVQKRTAVCDAAVVAPGIARGIRVSIVAPTGSQIPAVNVTPGQLAVGDFVTLQQLEVVSPVVQGATAARPGAVASMHGGGKVPAVGAVATNAGDVAYTATNGQFTNVATGATAVGTWSIGCPGAGLLGEVELGV